MLEAKQFDAVLVDEQGEVLVRKTPGVCGGAACVRNTRIMVWLLVALRNDGAADADLLRNYPSLGAPDLAAAWEYFRQHPEEIEQAIAENENNSD